MSSTRSRISVLAGLVAVLLAVLLLHLWFLMVAEHEVWARRSHENRWAFRAVPSRRGAILDRTGRVLAYDQPTMQVSVLYQRFRLRHPVGAAVHGATTWARLTGGELVTYGYLDGVLGPDAAVRDLLAIPCRELRPGVLDKRIAGELAFAATTVLSACAAVPRKVASAALRTAAQRGGDVTIGDVLTEVPAAILLANYGKTLASLRRFEHDLMAEQRARRPQHEAPSPDEPLVLFARLESLRRASLAGELVLVAGKRDGAVGSSDEPRWGDKKETIAWPIAEHVSFELAASLRTGTLEHLGLEVEPSVLRIVVEPDGTALRALLGSVAGIDRSEPDSKWLARYAKRELPENWLDDFVPADVGGTEGDREKLRVDATAGFLRETRRRERRGTIGIEDGFDDALTGRLGLRLVERDVTAREQTLWSNLRVEGGIDVQVTIDVELQRLAEQLVSRTRQATRALHRAAKDQDRVEVALAVIDAESGDILALAGAPVTGNAPRNVPGVVWHHNGALGSVVKPFVLIEQLEAEVLGRPCLPIGSLQQCSGSYVYGGKTLRCGHAHWQEGRDPVAAIGKSCNSFFYQCGVGLGADGVTRAMQRFGLQAAQADSPFAACWQPTIAGLRWYAPQRQKDEIMPRRAIGYGVAASPLAVARAYAALATGRLPTLGLRHGEQRPRVLLDGVQAEIEVARQGLDACVQSGTARGVTELGAFHVMGKTGTAEVGPKESRENNAWFAGFLPWRGGDGVQLCFCAVIYWVPDGEHGGGAPARLVADLLSAIAVNPELKARYVTPEGGR